MATKSSSSSFFLCTLSVIFSLSLFMQASLQQRSNVYVLDKVTWSEAQKYCREYYTDLATFRNKSELDAVQTFDAYCWIGLQRVKNGSDFWIWSDGEEVNFTQWHQGEPNKDKGIENCVATRERSWYDEPCNKKYAFLCYEDAPILVQENKTWEEALEHCETLHPDLSSSDIYLKYVYHLLQPDFGGFNSTISDAQTHEVWIGLRFLAGYWLWMDGNSLTEQLPVCPAAGKYCGTMSKTGQLQLSDCSEKRNFICTRD